MNQNGFHDIKSNCLDSVIDHTGANDNGMGTSRDSTCMETTDVSFDENRIDDNLNIRIYRFTFTDEFMNALYIFSKVHQYDDRKVFKEAWEIWLEENERIVEAEVKRLNDLNYEGNIIDKMFKSARYYFRKKSTEKKTPVDRREYISGDKELIEAMDIHILNEIREPDYKPSQGFDEFCKNHIDLLQKQVNYLCQCGINNSNEIKNKIKKTYKNRYFLISVK
jgi:hypothetical protein